MTRETRWRAMVLFGGYVLRVAVLAASGCLDISESLPLM